MNDNFIISEEQMKNLVITRKESCMNEIYSMTNNILISDSLENKSKEDVGGYYE